MLLGLLPTRPWLLMAPACLVIGSGGVAQAQVSAGGLGTRVNGTALGRCTGGICTVQGGTRAGQNQFYRFSQFDTRSKIKRVDLDTRGRRHVVVGVGAPNGSFFGAPVHLSEAANLFWLSPGGIWLGKGAGFSGATNLLLSTSPTMRFGGKEFDVLAATASDALRLDQGPNLDLERLAGGGGTDEAFGVGVGPIVLAGGRLRVDRNLLIDSGVGPIRSEPAAGPIRLEAGESVTLAGGELDLANFDVRAGNAEALAPVKMATRRATAAGAPGDLRLEEGVLRGSQVLLDGVGGLALRDVKASAVSPEEGKALLQLTAGTENQSASANLQGVALGADSIVVRSTGALRANDFQALASGSLKHGRVQLVSGMENQPPDGGAGLGLQSAQLKGGTVLLHAAGPMDLQQVDATAGEGSQLGNLWVTTGPIEPSKPKAKPSGTGSGSIRLEGVQVKGKVVVVKAAGDLQANGLGAETNGGSGRGDSLWLLSERPKGQDSGGAVSIHGGQLNGSVVTVRGAAGLALSNLRLVAGSSAAGGPLWLIGGDEDGRRGERVRLESVALSGREVRIRGGDLGVKGSSVAAQGKNGLIQLEAERPGGEQKGGRAVVESSRLDGQSIVMRSDGSMTLRNVAAMAGSPGSRGVIQLGRSSDLPGPRETAHLEGVDLKGQRIIVRSGSIKVEANSLLEAPKGLIHLEAAAGDLTVNRSTLDVGVHKLEDLLTPVAQQKDNASFERDEPSIGLFASGKLQVANKSKLLATQDLNPLRKIHPGLQRDSIQLTNTSGLVVARSGKRLEVESSVIAADASDNLAGNVILHSRGSDEQGGIKLTNSLLSTSGGGGSGDIRLGSSSGILISNSTLIAQSNKSASGSSDPDYSFRGGEITLTNESINKPITILDSAIQAHQSFDGGSLSSRSFWEPRSDFIDDFDTADNSDRGSRISVISAAGFSISGAKTLVTVEATAPPSSADEPLEGVLRLVNFSKIAPSIDPQIPLNKQALQVFPKGSIDEFRAMFRDSLKDLPHVFFDPPGRDQVIYGGISFETGVPDEIFKRKSPISNDWIFSPKDLPIRIDNPIPVPQNATPSTPSLSTTALPKVSSIETKIGYQIVAQYPRPAAMTTPLVIPSPTAIASSVAIANNSEKLSESSAAASFLSAEQAFSREVSAALSLQSRPLNALGIPELQEELRQVSSRSVSSPVPTGKPYVPAILQISAASIPSQGLIQLTQVLIPAKGAIQGWQSQVHLLQLKEVIRAFQQLLHQQAVLETTTAGQQLTALLLAPVLPELKRQGITALILSVDRNLQGVPFAALPIEGGSLVDQVAITITPSLQLTELQQQSINRGHRTLLAGASRFANGMAPLQMAAEELRQIASIYPGAEVMLDEAFHAQALLEKAREKPVDILHLATHAEFIDQQPDGARIYTSNGELALQELGKQLRQKQTKPIGLFVLNACRTAIGNEGRELGMAGLALQAGATSAIGNLWYVDDAVSAAFTVQFHRFMNQGLHKDQALQMTQQLFQSGAISVQDGQIMNSSNEVLLTGISRGDQQHLSRRLSHPYFWAGAILTGRPW